LIFTLLVFVSLFVGWRLWSNLYNTSPQFNYILISKNKNPLKLLKGEILHLHPEDKLRILKISTNIHFNRNIRLFSGGFDVNALLREEMPISTLLPNRDIFDQHKFMVKVKRNNRDIGYVEMVIEPHVEDWLDKARRTIKRSKRILILERALKLLPDNAQVRDRLIEEYRALKMWPQVGQMLEDMAKMKPDPKVFNDLIDVYEAMSNKEGIITTLKRFVEYDPNDIETRLRLASFLETSKNLKEAIKEYESILKVMEKMERLPVYKTLGYLYTETGQIGNAIARYLQAAELDEKDVNIYYNLSSLYESAGKNDRADFFLKKAVNLKSGDMESRLKLAERLIKNGKQKEAEKYLIEVLKKNPNSLEALLLMISIVEKTGDKKALIKVYKKIHSIDPKNETVIYNMGVLEYETGHLSKGQSYLVKWIKSHPDDAEAHGILFDIYKRLKKDKLAFNEAQTLIRLRPKEIGYYHFVFEYLNARKEYKKIIAWMKEGLRSHPKNTDLREYLILAHLKTGKEDLAMAQMYILLKEKPKDISLLLQLARLKEKHGKLKEALQTYKKIMDISPGHERAEEAYLRLRLKGISH
ncbi:MAG: tetratricopeptide repeat protein, partial [Thermodesulfobacteriota bacterium]|nr:tetratricopeptide repeat protein [Thermodesulfobacteriota bacterium]